MRVPLLLLLFAAPLAAAPVPKNLKGSGTIFVWKSVVEKGVGHPAMELYSPTGDHLKAVDFGHKPNCWVDQVSPDGKHLVLISLDPDDRPIIGGGWRQRLHLMPLTDTADPLPKPITEGWEPFGNWSADGKTLYASSYQQNTWQQGQPGQTFKAESRAVDVTSGKGEKLDLPDGHRVWGVSRDDREFLTYRQEPGGVRRTAHFRFTPGQEPTETDADAPDFAGWVRTGRSHRIPPTAEGDAPDEVKAGGVTFRLPAELKGKWTGRWSVGPDGRSVVVQWSEEVKVEGWTLPHPASVTRLGVCDTDGKNLKTVYAPKPTTIKELEQASVTDFAWR